MFIKKIALFSGSVFIFTSLVCGFSEDTTVYGKLKSGFQLAGKLLGIDQASGVAQLVTEAFGKQHSKGDSGDDSNSIFSGFLRVLGFDAKKIGAIAVNAIIFIAQMISSSLTSNKIKEGRVRQGSPMDWIMSNSEVINMLAHIKDKDLPNHIIKYIQEQSLDEETDCIQLLVCKSAPFIWGMQKALDDKNGTVTGPKWLYAYLPTMEEVEDNADFCDKKHPFCLVDV